MINHEIFIISIIIEFGYCTKKKNENYTHIYTHTDIPHACESINANNYDKKKDLTKEEKYSVTFKRIYNVTHIIF